ncbi:hypothetical protein [Sphingomonas sp.]|uniref:hypothetical protein n=1 Tax=Sphingomonas sp. TaxID=28214 RepID=UPI0031D3E392
MIDRIGLGAGIAALLLLAACDAEPPKPAASGEPEANASADNAAAIAAPDNASAAAEGPLSKYVGKHPSDRVDGMRFLDEPMVRKAVAANVSDAAARKFVFGYDGPDAPIVAKAGRVLAWGCERHNCGYHNWAISITPDGASADVCFYRNPDRPDGSSTWYLADGKREQRQGNCPSE